MKLIKDPASVWDTDMVEGVPFGIEKIAPRDYVAFQLWGNRRIYLNNSEGFTSKAKAIGYLESRIAKYKESIVVSS